MSTPPPPSPWTQPPSWPQPVQQPPPGYRLPPPPVLPTTPSEYQHLLRGPAHRWWRPLLSIGLLAVFVVVGVVGFGSVILAAGLMSGLTDPLLWVDEQLAGDVDNPQVFFATNLMLIMLIPAALAALSLAHRAKVRFVASVTGRFRWGWFGRCVLVLVPLWLLYVGGAWLLGGGGSGPRPQQWLALSILIITTTPLQSAAEEIVFRGWFLQSIGSWFASRWLALAVPTILSVAFFGAAHGSPDLWILTDLAIFSVVASLLTWRTGGLEAAIALHAVNNVVAMGFSVLVGGFGEGFIDETTTGDPLQVAVSLVVNGIALALLWRMAARGALPWRYQPAQTDPVGS